MSGIRDLLRGVAALLYAGFVHCRTWGMHPASPYFNKTIIVRAKLEGPRVRY